MRDRPLFWHPQFLLPAAAEEPHGEEVMGLNTGIQIWLVKNGNPQNGLPWKMETWKTCGPYPSGLILTHTHMFLYVAFQGYPFEEAKKEPLIMEVPLDLETN